MSSSPANPVLPSVFISYASADREAARSINAVLAKAGLDVWLDEEELAGGEAWDSKIRQQIRTCTYFMPLISATTEVRREGYFRREWRFAVERTLDLADDVLFLVPVVIDDTDDVNARVPEKFTTVQWLRCPGGRETEGLVDLAARMVHEHAHGSTLPDDGSGEELEAGLSGTPSARLPDGQMAGLPDRPVKKGRRHVPFPVFPPFPEHGNWARFAYHLVVWGGRMIYAFWNRLPRMLQIAATVLIVFKSISLVFDWNTTANKPTVTVSGGRGAQGGRGSAAGGPVDRTPGGPGGGGGFANRGGPPGGGPGGQRGGGRGGRGQTMLDPAAIAADADLGGKTLAVIPFVARDQAIHDASVQFFETFQKALLDAGNKDEIAISASPLNSGDETDLTVRAGLLNSKWLLAGNVRADQNDPDKLVVTLTLYDGAPPPHEVWKEEKSSSIADPDPTAKELAADLRQHVTFP